MQSHFLFNSYLKKIDSEKELKALATEIQSLLLPGPQEDNQSAETLLSCEVVQDAIGRVATRVNYGIPDGRKV